MDYDSQGSRNRISPMASHAPSEQAESAPTPPVIRGVPADERRALVIGASSGMGAALVKQLASEGYSVAAVARRQEALDQLAEECADACDRTGGVVHVHAHDVKDTEEVAGLFEEIVRELGGLDLVVYAAGVMPSVERDQFDTEIDHEILAVNLGGCVAWGNVTARLFHTQRRGTLVGISSIAGVRGRKGQPVYGTSKAGMDHYLEALRNRLADVGAHVCTIKPGFVDTPMTEGLGLKGAISAEEAARQILRAARSRAGTRYVPLKWAAVALVVRYIPSFLFKRLNI